MLTPNAPRLSSNTSPDIRRSNSRLSSSITDIDDDLFSEPPRRAPRPPARRNVQDETSEHLSVTDLSLKFPSPPGHQAMFSDLPFTISRSRATKFLPMRFKKPRHSPASSISDASTYSDTNSSSYVVSTPATSDDEAAAPAITVNPKRLTMIFTKSLPDLPHNVGHGFLGPDNISPLFSSKSLPTTAPQREADLDSEEEDPIWIVEDMKDFLTLSAPTFPSVPGSSSDEDSVASRPESFLPTIRTSKTYSTSVYPSLGPSAQLDPTFPFNCRKETVPSRPLPPPIPSSQPVTTSTTDTKPATSSAPHQSLSTHLNRPPPRTSIPVDVDELMQMDLDDFDFLEEYLKGEGSDFPISPIYPDYYFSPISSLGLDHQDLPARVPSSAGHSQPDSSLAQMYDLESVLRGQISSVTPNRRSHLRSRWSTSTLSPPNSQQPPSSSWMSKFALRTKKSKLHSAPSTSTLSPTAKPTKKEKHKKFTGPNFLCDRLELDEHRLDRRDSRSSRTSADSAESTSCAGLRRKPIPVEIFMKI